MFKAPIFHIFHVQTKVKIFCMKKTINFFYIVDFYSQIDGKFFPSSVYFWNKCGINVQMSYFANFITCQQWKENLKCLGKKLSCFFAVQCDFKSLKELQKVLGKTFLPRFENGGSIFSFQRD